tara:strand:+ start:73 stop:450 length:378 start_codon:yes stop_codon:yes gene_type:complete
MKKFLGIIILNFFFISSAFSQINLLCTDNRNLTETHKVYTNEFGEWCWKGISKKDCRYIPDEKPILFLGYQNIDQNYREYISVNRYTGDYWHTFYSTKYSAEKGRHIDVAQEDNYGKCIKGEKLF